VYTDIKPNLVGDYVKLLTTLHFPSSTGYQISFSFVQNCRTIIYRVHYNSFSYKNADVLFEDSDIPCVVTLHFKNKYPAQ
jgi:hypothetical protein